MKRRSRGASRFSIGGLTTIGDGVPCSAVDSCYYKNTMGMRRSSASVAGNGGGSGIRGLDCSAAIARLVDQRPRISDTRIVEPSRYSVRLPDGREFGPAPMEMVLKWASEGRVPPDAMIVSTEGGLARPVLSDPALAGIIGTLVVPSMHPPSAPPVVSTGIPQQSRDGSISVIIPYKNPHALVGYYVSIGSLLPLVGLIAGPAAIVLGIIGIRKRKADPRLHGLAHAWVAIILGFIGLLIGLGCTALIIIGIMSERSGR